MIHAISQQIQSAHSNVTRDMQQADKGIKRKCSIEAALETT